METPDQLPRLAAGLEDFRKVIGSAEARIDVLGMAFAEGVFCITATMTHQSRVVGQVQAFYTASKTNAAAKNDQVQIHNLYVVPEDRRRGFGTLLMLEMNDLLKGLGFSTAVLHVVEEDLPELDAFYDALRFYPALWSDTGRWFAHQLI